MTTVTPLSVASGIELKRTDNLSEDAFDEGKADIRTVIGKRVRARKTAIICSHGPVLPDILREIALATGTPTGAYICGCRGSRARRVLRRAPLVDEPELRHHRDRDALAARLIAQSAGVCSALAVARAMRVLAATACARIVRAR